MPTLTAKTITAKTLTARNIGQGEAAFSLADLFAASEAGAWYDPSDLSTMWQDAARTVAAVVNSPVRVTDDKSGNGNHATAPSDAARPILRESGGLYYLEFDGIDDNLVMPNMTDGAVGSDNTAVFGCYKSTPTASYLFGGNLDSGVEALFSSTYLIRPAIKTTAGTIVANGTTAKNSVAFVYSLDWKRSEGRLRGWQNMIEEVNVTGTPADKTESTVYALCMRGADFPMAGRIYGGVIIDRQLPDVERQDLEAWMAAKSGVTL